VLSDGKSSPPEPHGGTPRQAECRGRPDKSAATFGLSAAVKHVVLAFQGLGRWTLVCGLVGAYALRVLWAVRLAAPRSFDYEVPAPGAAMRSFSAASMVSDFRAAGLRPAFGFRKISLCHPDSTVSSLLAHAAFVGALVARSPTRKH
jgi:hypothetical protein